MRAEAAGLARMTGEIELAPETAPLALRLPGIVAPAQEIVVTADVSRAEIASPDPSQKVMVREQLLDANSGAEYEYGGHKSLHGGNPNHSEPYEAIPVGETRMAPVRSFLDGKLEVGMNGLVARGYTGQTTEPSIPPGVCPPARHAFRTVRRGRAPAAYPMTSTVGRWSGASASGWSPMWAAPSPEGSTP